jgi:RNA polymerase sigma-70 factor (ECF subfamily)
MPHSRDPADGNEPPTGGTRPGLAPADLAELRPRLLSLVRRVCPRWLKDQAEDIVQAAIVGVLERFREQGGSLPVSSSYLMRAAHNAAVDEIRRRFRRPETEGGDAAQLALAASEAHDPARRSEALEIDRAIRACLALLGPARRAAVMLFLLGYSRAEIERLSGWGRKRSEHLTYRGLADLRRCLSEKGLEP